MGCSGDVHAGTFRDRGDDSVAGSGTAPQIHVIGCVSHGRTDDRSGWGARARWNGRGTDGLQVGAGEVASWIAADGDRIEELSAAAHARSGDGCNGPTRDDAQNRRRGARTRTEIDVGGCADRIAAHKAPGWTCCGARGRRAARGARHRWRHWGACRSRGGNGGEVIPGDPSCAHRARDRHPGIPTGVHRRAGHRDARPTRND